MTPGPAEGAGGAGATRPHVPAVPDGGGTIAPPARPGARAQTLDRGLVVLEVLAAAGTPLSISQVCAAAGLHRSIVYRLLRTLEDRRLVSRAADETYELGLGLLALTRGMATDLRSAAGAELPVLADVTGMTAFVVVRDGAEAVTLFSVQPDVSRTHVAYAPGNRHSVGRGAPGLALLMAAPPVPGERPEVAAARGVGWIGTVGEVLPGLSAIAAPLPRPGRRGAAVAVVFLGEVEERVVGEHVRAAARRIADRLA